MFELLFDVHQTKAHFSLKKTKKKQKQLHNWNLYILYGFNREKKHSITTWLAGDDGKEYGFGRRGGRGPTSGLGESGGWFPTVKPFNHRHLHGCHFRFGQVSGSKRNQRTFPMSIHSLPWHLHAEIEVMHEKIKRETALCMQRLHTECLHACMYAISVTQDINQSTLFNRDLAGGDTYRINQCPSIGGRSNRSGSWRVFFFFFCRSRLVS